MVRPAAVGERTNVGIEKRLDMEKNQMSRSTTTIVQPNECHPTRKILYFAKDIKPPVLGSQQEYCNQVLAQGLSLPNCELGKAAACVYPNTLFFGREEGIKPESSKQIKNWKKWCNAWKYVESRVKKDAIPPSIMTCGEGYRRKREDVELFERTVHRENIYGNNIYPHPSRKEYSSIEELEPRRIYRGYPEVEKIRISKEIRKEMGLPLRDPPTEPSDLDLGTVWKWDKQWNNSMHVRKYKHKLEMSSEPLDLLHPCPDTLTVIGNLISIDNRIGLGGKPTRHFPPPPDIIFTKDSEDVVYSPETDTHVEEGQAGEVYREQRGPVLYIEGERIRHYFHIKHKQRQKSKYTHHEVIDEVKPKLKEEETYLCDIMDGFSATTKCKEVRYVILKNDGTTVIRYQWLRSPPNAAMRKLLANPGSSLQQSFGSNTIENFDCDRFPKEFDEHHTKKKQEHTVVHLTNSRLIDPDLTSTLKFMTNCATADRAFENLLLLMSLKIPRLKRLLVRRTGRQFKPRKLPIHIQQLYWKQLEKKRIQRKPTINALGQSQAPKSGLMEEIAIVVREPTPPEEELVEEVELPPALAPLQQFCPCEAGEDGSEEDEHVCRCILPCSYYKRNEIQGEEGAGINQFRPCEEIQGEGANEVLGEGLLPEKSFSEEVLRCLAWGEDEDGEGVAIPLPREATPDFYPLYKGPPPRQSSTTAATSDTPKSSLTTQLPKCKDLIEKVRTEVRTIYEPDPLQPWMSTQIRDSLLEPVPEDDNLLLHVDESDQWEPQSDPPIFREMRNYQVTQDYRPGKNEADIIVGENINSILEQDDSQSIFDGEGDGIPAKMALAKQQIDTVSIGDFKIPPLVNSIQLGLGEIYGEEENGEEYEGEEMPPAEPVQDNSTVLEDRKMSPSERMLEILKEPSFEFHFQELPGILLPGQMIEFPIIFRPRKAGVFHETIYLLTHPQITTETYCVRLNGICVNPDIGGKLQSGSAGASMVIKKIMEQKDTTTENNKKKDVRQDEIGIGSGKEKTQIVQNRLNDNMLKQQGIDLLDTIIDHVLFTNQTRTSTLPYGKVTKESLFLAHNPTLHYYREVCEKGLSTLRNICALVVPKDRLEDGICQLDIRSLYSTLWEKNPQFEDEETQSFFDTNLKSETVEELLKEFATYSSKMIQPRTFTSLPKKDLIFNVSYSTICTLIDRIVTGFENIRKHYGNTELDNMYRKKILGKKMFDGFQKAVEFEEALVKAMEEEEQRRILAEGPTKTVGTQKSLGLGPDDEITIFEELIPDLTAEDETEQGSAAETPLNVESTDDIVGIKESKSAAKEPVSGRSDTAAAAANATSTTGNNKKRGKKRKESKRKPKEKQEPNLLDEDTMTPEEIEFRHSRKRRTDLLKQLMVEKYLGDGIEKMLSVIDTFKYSYKFAESNVIKKTDPSRYCC